MQVKIGIRFHRARITYFQINGLYITSSRLYAKAFFFDKQTIYQKLRNSNGNNFSFIPHLCYFFISPLDCFFQRSEFDNTILYQNEGQRNSHKNINIPLSFYQSSITLPLPSVKTIKNLRSIRKFKHVRQLYGPRAMYFPRADAQNSQYIVYLL